MHLYVLTGYTACIILLRKSTASNVYIIENWEFTLLLQLQNFVHYIFCTEKKVVVTTEVESASLQRESCPCDNVTLAANLFTSGSDVSLTFDPCTFYYIASGSN